MIIEDPLEMGSMVRSIIETNPLALLLNKEQANHNNNVSTYESIKHDTLDLKRRVNNSLIEQNVYKQLVAKSTTKLRLLQKTLDESSNEFECNFLNRESMAKFFESMGLKFIALNIAQSGSQAHLSYVRPARMISTLPVQPMIVTLYYELKNGTLRFKRPEITTVLSASNNMHPHISGETVCLGNFFDVFDSGNYSIHLEGYQDQVILLENLFSTFNPDSPYARIDQIITAIAKGVSYNLHEVAVIRNACYTFLNPKLVTNSHYLYAVDLITEDLYRDFYALLGDMPIKDTAQDIINSLPNEYRDSDSGSENYEHFCSVQSSLNKMFNTRLAHPDNYADYYEDEDIYQLDESQFEDMIQSWIETLEKYTESEEFFVFESLLDLNAIFPKPVIAAEPIITHDENPDSIRGIYLDGVVLDEYAQCDPTILIGDIYVSN